ncbi:MAG: hypothetical protein J0H62_01935 [Rhizobiales bacterium]|nr:hypothetical protein [Hyphomicrobiales bacterium]
MRDIRDPLDPRFDPQPGLAPQSIDPPIQRSAGSADWAWILGGLAALAVVLAIVLSAGMDRPISTANTGITAGQTPSAAGQENTGSR